LPRARDGGPGREADPCPGRAALKRARRRNIAGKTDAILAALRRLASRLAGILHGCLKTRTLYDKAAACVHQGKTPVNLPSRLEI
jgi:hypothetical protein